MNFLFLKFYIFSKQVSYENLIFTVKAWNEIYGEDKPIGDNFIQKRMHLSQTQHIVRTSSTYIFQCTFITCQYTSGNGGCIFFNNSNYLLVEFCSFSNCSTSELGGCVYAENCNCVINCDCSFKCIATYSGQSFYIKVNSVDRINYLIQSSVSSDNPKAGFNSPITLQYGKKKCSSLNISNNYADYYSAIYFEHDSTNPSILEYCSLNSNKAEQYSCIVLGNAGHSYQIEKCNILKNTQGEDTYGTFYCFKLTEIIDCCILENSGQIDNFKLFYSPDNSSITVKDCTLSLKYNVHGNVTTNNALTSKPFINVMILNDQRVKCFETNDDLESDLALPVIPIFRSPLSIISTQHKSLFSSQLSISIFTSIYFSL